MDFQNVNSYWILDQCQHPFEIFYFSSDILDILFFELVTNCLTNFLSVNISLEPYLIPHCPGYIPNKKVSTTNIQKKTRDLSLFWDPSGFVTIISLILFSEIALFLAILAQTWTWSNWTPWRTSFHYYLLPGTYGNLQVAVDLPNFFSCSFLSNQHFY